MDLFNIDVVAQYGGALLRGLSVTVFLTIVVILAALVLAIPVALMISAMTADASDWRTLVVASAAALGYVLIAGIRDLRWFLTHR